MSDEAANSRDTLRRRVLLPPALQQRTIFRHEHFRIRQRILESDFVKNLDSFHDFVDVSDFRRGRFLLNGGRDFDRQIAQLQTAFRAAADHADCVRVRAHRDGLQIGINYAAVGSYIQRRKKITLLKSNFVNCARRIGGFDHVEHVGRTDLGANAGLHGRRQSAEGFAGRRQRFVIRIFLREMFFVRTPGEQNRCQA